MTQPTPWAPWIAAALTLVGCAGERDGTRQSAASVAPHVVALSIVDRVFQAPDTINAGWTTFRFANHGDDIHYAHFVQLDSGKTESELVAAYAEAIRTSGPRPKWVKRFGGPGGAAPGDSAVVTQYLEPGAYVLICPVEDSAGNPHFGKGEFRTLVVRPAGADANARRVAPVATDSIHLLDFAFALDGPLASGTQMLQVTNTGAEPHDLVLLRLAPGVTIEDVRRTMNPERARRSDEAATPPMSIASLGTLVGGVAAMRSGMEVFFRADLTPGEYVLLCMATAPDGRSHIEHGMLQMVHVQ